MAVDPFEDDPFAEGEIVPAAWKRQARTARQSLQRAQRVQAAQVRRGPPENLADLAGGGVTPQVGGGVGDAAGGELAQGIRELNEHARAIRQLLEEIKNSLPAVGAYGP